MSVEFYLSLKAKRTEDVEDIQSHAKELNKEYNLPIMEDGPEPADGLYGLKYIIDGINFTTIGSASDEIRRFKELVKRIVKSHPDMPVEYYEGPGYLGHLYYSRNGELIKYIPGTMCLCVESDEAKYLFQSFNCTLTQ